MDSEIAKIFNLDVGKCCFKLVHRLRRWPNIKIPLNLPSNRWILKIYDLDVGQLLAISWATACDAGPTFTSIVSVSTLMDSEIEEILIEYSGRRRSSVSSPVNTCHVGL